MIELEILGGLAVMVGWHTRVFAFLLAGFSLLSAVLFHANFGDQMQMIMFMKNLSIAGGFLIIVALGGGAYALDNRPGKEAALLFTSTVPPTMSPTLQTTGRRCELA